MTKLDRLVSLVFPGGQAVYIQEDSQLAAICCVCYKTLWSGRSFPPASQQIIKFAEALHLARHPSHQTAVFAVTKLERRAENGDPFYRFSQRADPLIRPEITWDATRPNKRFRRS